MDQKDFFYVITSHHNLEREMLSVGPISKFHCFHRPLQYNNGSRMSRHFLGFDTHSPNINSTIITLSMQLVFIISSFFNSLQISFSHQLFLFSSFSLAVSPT